jgi:hypothetical protein
MMAAMLALISGNAIGADNAEAQPAKPEVTNTQEPSSNTQKPSSNSQPKEEAASKNSSESDTSKEEPNCN